MSSTPTPSRPSPPTSSRIAARVNRDWEGLLLDRRARARAARWTLADGWRPGGLEAALGAVGGDRSLADEQADRHLAALVVHARTDDLAARVVVQRVVPGLVHAARRHGYLGVQAAFDELVGTAWVLARTYPVERRPRWIAANLCRDAAYEAFVRPRRLRAAEEEPLGVHLPDGQAALSTGIRPNSRRAVPSRHVGVMRSGQVAVDDELRSVLLDARHAGLAPDRLALLVQLHLLGRHPRAVADELQISERTVRIHRDAAARQLSRLAVAA